MTFDEIRFALVVSGVEQEDIETLIAYSKNKGTNYKILDEMLTEMCYEKVFTDEYDSTEKIRHKHKWQD